MNVLVSSALHFVGSTVAGRVLAAAVGVALIGGLVVAPRLSGGAAPVATRTQPVARGNVTQTIGVSGAVNASSVYKLSFRTSGRLTDVMVKVGQIVTLGQALAKIDPADLQTSVKQAEANVLNAQAKYDTTVAGATSEDVALAKNSLDSAQKNYEDSQRTTQRDVSTADQAFTKMKQTYSGAQTNYSLLTDGVKTDLGQFTRSIDELRFLVATALADFKTISTSDVTSAKSSLGQVDSSLINAGTYANNQLASALREWISARDNVVSAYLQFDSAVLRGTDTTGAVGAVQNAQLAYTLATNKLTTALDPASSPISSAQSNVSSAQNSLNSSTSKIDPGLDLPRADLISLQTALVNESTLVANIKTKITQAGTFLGTIIDAVNGSYLSSKQALDTAKDKAASTVTSQESALRSSQLNFEKTTASAKVSDIASAYASLQLAQLALDKARADLDGATLRAPAAGVIATVANGVGESPANPVMTLAVVSTLVLHGTTGEADIAKLKTGQVATVTVDAAGGGGRMTGRVSGLDPVATIQQGVPVYGVDVQIDIPDPAVRPGMSGTATVIIASKQSVLTVPNSAIRTSGGVRTLQVMRDGKVEDARVTFGIANDTVTEVLTGLSEGDLVVLPQPRTGATTTTTQQRPGAGGTNFQLGPGGDVPH
ncbi:MAG: HlyD family efflux transporter periplasmic adaptor subunit [Chloroflexi bacterium]|nr:HlyD family efflux transporter periplasmic adaptor subunit [Chloroflexota bacterium]